MADDRLELAYDAAIHALSNQDTTLANLRNRATGLLSAAALVTSFAAGLGLINTGRSEDSVFPTWAAIVLLAVLVAIGATSLFVLWPIPWCRGASSPKIMEKVAEGSGIDQIRDFVVDDLEKGHDVNEERLKLRARCYQIGVVLLVAEVVALVMGFLLS